MRLKQEADLPFGHVLEPLHLPTLQAEAARIAREHAGQPEARQHTFKSHSATSTTHIYPLANPRYKPPETVGGIPTITKETYEILQSNPKPPLKLPRNLPPEDKPGPYQAWSASYPSQKALDVPPRALVATRYVWQQATTRSRKGKDTVLVFVHGTGFCKDLFLPLLDAILSSLGSQESANITEAWMLDAIGHGETRKLNRDEGRDNSFSNYDRYFNEEDCARDIIQFLGFFLPRQTRPSSSPTSHLPTALAPIDEAEVSKELQRDVILIGHSIGATTSMQVAFHCPELVRSVICIEPIIVPFEFAIFDVHPLPLWALKRRDRWPDRKTAREFFDKDRFYRAWTPEAKDLFAENGLRQEGSEVALASDRVAEALSYHGTSNGFWIPAHIDHFPPQIDVFYLCCEEPLILPVDEVHKLIGGRPNFSFAAIDGGHALHLERPVETGRLIANFIKKLADNPKL